MNMDLSILKELAKAPLLAEQWALEPRYPAMTENEEKILQGIHEYINSLSGSVIYDMLGVKVVIDGQLPPATIYLILNDAYEHGDLALIRKYINRHDTALVCCAGMGVIACAIAQQCGKAVSMIEANPAMEPFCKKTADANEVEIPFICGAIVPGRQNGTVSFTVSEEFRASSLRHDTYRPEKTITVPIVDLHALVQQASANVLFVDIEGAEYSLFTHNSIPSSVTKIFVEIHRPDLGNEKWAQVMNDLFSLGFRLVDADGLTQYWTRHENKTV
jgi:FkbM family methyltransferase